MSTTDAPNQCKDGAPMVYFPPHPTPPLSANPALSPGSELSIEPHLLLVAKVGHCPAGRPLTCPVWAIQTSASFHRLRVALMDTKI